MTDKTTAPTPETVVRIEIDPSLLQAFEDLKVAMEDFGRQLESVRDEMEQLQDANEDE